ncbi:hypothetical protein CKAH01_18646 [Colletotrichum kahawae]|uniref:Uncharacterized protein n=1 Tax=Colletotrichum kahawae TaxID=34407 RepID=A0AAD9Y6H0_COLKA|nr:hypothetical protein CKAH01_18646 [Colletotrichum kahawae]
MMRVLAHVVIKADIVGVAIKADRKLQQELEPSHLVVGVVRIGGCLRRGPASSKGPDGIGLSYARDSIGDPWMFLEKQAQPTASQEALHLRSSVEFSSGGGELSSGVAGERRALEPRSDNRQALIGGPAGRIRGIAQRGIALRQTVAACPSSQQPSLTTRAPIPAILDPAPSSSIAALRHRLAIHRKLPNKLQIPPSKQSILRVAVRGPKPSVAALVAKRFPEPGHLAMAS